MTTTYYFFHLTSFAPISNQRFIHIVAWNNLNVHVLHPSMETYSILSKIRPGEVKRKAKEKFIYNNPKREKKENLTRGYDARRDQVSSGRKMVIQDRTEKRYLYVYCLLFTFREFRDGPLNFYLICSQQKKVRKRNWAAARSLSLFFFLFHLKKKRQQQKQRKS